jgi:hypothetical protein
MREHNITKVFGLIITFIPLLVDTKYITHRIIMFIHIYSVINATIFTFSSPYDMFAAETCGQEEKKK